MQCPQFQCTRLMYINLNISLILIYKLEQFKQILWQNLIIVRIFVFYYRFTIILPKKFLFLKLIYTDITINNLYKKSWNFFLIYIIIFLKNIHLYVAWYVDLIYLLYKRIIYTVKMFSTILIIHFNSKTSIFFFSNRKYW
jgi:hypothetical protein